MDRAKLAAAANEAALGCRDPGAPALHADSSRETLIRWLSWNDPNGDYADPDVWHEGPNGLLDPGWYVSAADGRSWFADTANGEADARAYAAETQSTLDELWGVLAEAVELED